MIEHCREACHIELSQICDSYYVVFIEVKAINNPRTIFALITILNGYRFSRSYKVYYTGCGIKIYP